MANYAATLTLSPSNSASPFSFHRRGSIRRGTISSISKDIRVNDVKQVIHQQKLIQKERTSVNMEEQLLKRRKSMISLRTTTAKTRTMSNSDLIKQDTLINHIKKCEACNTTPAYSCNEKEEEEDNSSTGSFSSCDFNHSNHTTSSSLISNTMDTSSTSMTELAQLNQLTNDFANLLKDLQQDQHNMDKIQQAQSILSQQQHYLNQLQTKNSPSSSGSSNNTLRSIYQDMVSSLITPRPSTTKIIIKQTPDKNEFNTIYSLQGICTTTEASYIPHQQLQKANNAKFYHFRYLLEINYDDRQNKFTLASEWKNDDDVDTCQETNCHVSFNWYQRKHHCRKCGNIYCQTHSANRLPLFTDHKPDFSRVCDACFFSLTSNSLHSP